MFAPYTTARACSARGHIVYAWCDRVAGNGLNTGLWSSWICKTPGMTYYFGGDTGYCGDMFKRIGQIHPVDLAAIPIAAYGQPEERWFHAPNHMNPGAVRVRARPVVPFTHTWW
eukprot:m.100125 g.100125  ORF g.100125 m.100125 type:complete len:114 (-) comp16775_c1_seq7:574-915(-)